MKILNRKAVFNIGALLVVVVLLLGVGMYFFNGYTGALVSTSMRYKSCVETEDLFTTSDNNFEAKQSIFKRGGTKTSLVQPITFETCENSILTER